MKNRKQFLRAVTAALLLLAVSAGPVLACPVCFGESDSPMAKGINMGVLVLLGVTGVVLAAFVSLIFTIWYRIHRYEKRVSTLRTVVLASTSREN